MGGRGIAFVGRENVKNIQKKKLLWFGRGNLELGGGGGGGKFPLKKKKNNCKYPMYLSGICFHTQASRLVCLSRNL